MTFSEALDMELETLKNKILEKNIKYGNSALNPIRVFSKAPIDEGIKVRLDDKLSRIRNQMPDDTEDSVLDLLGYLVLLRIYRNTGGRVEAKI